MAGWLDLRSSGCSRSAHFASDQRQLNVGGSGGGGGWCVYCVCVCVVVCDTGMPTMCLSHRNAGRRFSSAQHVDCNAFGSAARARDARVARKQLPLQCAYNASYTPSSQPINTWRQCRAVCCCYRLAPSVISIHARSPVIVCGSAALQTVIGCRHRSIYRFMIAQSNNARTDLCSTRFRLLFGGNIICPNKHAQLCGRLSSTWRCFLRMTHFHLDGDYDGIALTPAPSPQECV